MAFVLSYWLALALLGVLLALRTQLARSPAREHGWVALAREGCLFVAAYLVYFCVRGLAKDHVTLALRHARAVLALEQRAGFAWERTLQGWVLHADLLIDIVNWIYVWLFWPLLAVALVWLFQRHRPEYARYRNAILLSGAMGLVVFLFYPVAPPRFLENGQFVDTVGERSVSYQLLLPHTLANLYAAMPSLHAGWVLIVGIAIARHAAGWQWRVLGALLPVAMFLSIISTANHYILDGLVGWSFALLALVIARAWAPSRARAGWERRDHERWSRTAPSV